jgi:hypothetical protein
MLLFQVRISHVLRFISICVLFTDFASYFVCRYVMNCGTSLPTLCENKTSYTHLHSVRVSKGASQWQYVPPKRRRSYTRLHGVRSLKAVLSIVTAVRISNQKQLFPNICGVFHYGSTASSCTASNLRCWMHNELEKMCVEAVVAWSEKLSWHLPKGTD